MSSDNRTIAKAWKSKPTIEGAGVHLKRAFGFDQVPELDPFLLLDDFHSDDPRKYLAGFPWHPHRGIETITYVLEGRVEHGDSMGNAGVISPGDVQWMTAGSGIIHQEMPKGSDTGSMWGFQLWANLPASHKMMDPRYRDVTASQIPEVPLAGGVTAKVVCGALNGVSGPVTDIVTDPEYYDITVPPDTTYSHATKPGHTALIYTVEGKAYYDEARDSYAHDVVGATYSDFARDCAFGPEYLLQYKREGDAITVTTRGEGARFLLVSGRSLGEPVAWYGPIVMNTREELRVAFDEYSNGTFLKHK